MFKSQFTIDKDTLLQLKSQRERAEKHQRNGTQNTQNYGKREATRRRPPAGFCEFCGFCVRKTLTALQRYSVTVRKNLFSAK